MPSAYYWGQPYLFNSLISLIFSREKKKTSTGARSYFCSLGLCWLEGKCKSVELFGKTGETNRNVSAMSLILCTMSLILCTKTKCVSTFGPLIKWCSVAFVFCAAPSSVVVLAVVLQCAFVGRKEDVIIEDNHKFPVLSLPEKKFSVVFFTRLCAYAERVIQMFE